MARTARFTKQEKVEIRKVITNELGVNYDAQMIVDSILQAQAFLFTEWQIKQHEEYCKRFGLNRKITYLGNRTWEIR